MEFSSVDQSNVTNSLNSYFEKYQAARLESENRLLGIRKPKLGDLHIQEDFYRELVSLFREVITSRKLRDSTFNSKIFGFKARILLLVFMSEMIYREYERSFWDKLWEILRIHGGNLYGWTTEQMVRAYEENSIELLRSGYLGRIRREYVRTIISESGFSQRLVHQAKSFVIWFFDKYPENDPRLLNYEVFEKILDEYGIASKDDAFELLRGMVRAVGKLLREIRNRSISATDIENDEIIAELEAVLGFHPIKGIFGFRNREDIIDLIEKLSQRIRPERFEQFLRKRTHGGQYEIDVETPSGEKIRTKKIKDILPAQYGEYKFSDETILVVPREAISFNHLFQLLITGKKKFHEDGDWLYLYDANPFEIIYRKQTIENPKEYCVDGKFGYLWYGRQPIGMSVSAERDGIVLDYFDPKIGLEINPRIRLDKKREELLISIPSFSLFNPKFAGQTVRIELNNEPIENTTYIVSDRGGLHFQGTRIAKIDLNKKQLVLRVATVKEGTTLAEKKILGSLQTNLLFSKTSRELIRTGEKDNAGKEFLLFVGEQNDLEFKNLTNVKIRSTSTVGRFTVYDLEWSTEMQGVDKEFHLKIGNSEWLFHSLLELYLKIDSQVKYIDFEPTSSNAFFSLNDINFQIIRIDRDFNRLDLSKWSILMEKDQEVIDNISLSEIDRLGWIKESSAKAIYLNLYKFLNRYLEQHKINILEGTYNLTLMYQKIAGGDIEILNDIEFMLLPKLSLNKLDKIYFEGVGDYATITSDQPVLIDSEDRVSTVIQEFFVPEIEVNSSQNALVPRQIKKTVRLSFPATKVAVNLAPETVVAVRLRAGTRILSLDKSSIEYRDLAWSALLLSFPAEMQPILTCDDYNEDIRTRYFPLGKLSGHINKQKVKVKIRFLDKYEKDFTVIRHIQFHFVEQGINLTRTPEEVGIELYFQVDGPSELEVQFKFTDNKFNRYDPYVFPLQELRIGKLSVHLPSQQLQGVKSLYCSVLIDGDSLGKITIPLVEEDKLLGKEREKQEIVQEVNDLILKATKGQDSERNLIDLLTSVRIYESEDCIRQVLTAMYTVERLEDIRNKIKRNNISQELVDEYFSQFSPKYFPEIEEEFFIPTIKKFCRIEVPELLSICSEKLIARNDGIGVEVLIEDLMVMHKIDWEIAMRILRTNPELSAERITEIVKLEPIEDRDFEYIDTFMFVGKEFYPPIVKIARAAKDWKRAKNHIETNEIIESKVADIARNGVSVPFGSIVGIITSHSIDWKKHGLQENSSSSEPALRRLLNEKVRFIITEANRQKGRLFFSEVAASILIAHNLLESLKPGIKVMGVVTNLTDFGAFVDIGGISGLIHISEISWDRVKHPSQFLKVGDTVEVLVIAVDKMKEKINLSLKRIHD
jgi:DNA-directed RNA polymerase subunit E'/Rpb7